MNERARMDTESARVVYQQYFVHARHAESQRLTFTTIYAILVTGILAYLGATQVSSEGKLVLLSFWLILSLFGYLAMYAWNLAFVKFSRLAEFVATNELYLQENYLRFSKYKKTIRVARLFMALYSLMIGFSTSLLVQELATNTRYIILGPVIFIICYYWYQYVLEKRIQKSVDTRRYNY